MTPRLSVVLANYNHARYLAQSIGSVLGQSFRDLELLIMDDASTDDSVAVIRRVTAHDPRVTLLVAPVNRGAGATYDALTARARGEYLHSFAADDALAPDFYARAIACLDAHPAAGFCFGSFERLFEETGAAVSSELRWSDAPRYFSPDAYAASVERFGGAAIGLTSVVRRARLDAAGGFDWSLRWYNDWYCLLNLAFRDGACFLPGICATNRIRAAGLHALGSSRRATQEPLIGEILRRIESLPDPRALGLWLQSGSVGDMGPFILSTVLTHREHWTRARVALVYRGVRARIRTRVERALRGERAVRR